MVARRPSGPLGSWLPDLLAGVLAAAVLVAVTLHIPVASDKQAVDSFGVLVLAGAGAAVGMCRRRPVAALALITAVLAAYIIRDYPGGPVWAAGWVVLGALSWRRNRAVGLVGAAVFCSTLLAAAAVHGELAPLIHLVFIGWSVAAVLVGDALRVRGQRFVELEERARELERTREEETRRQVAEERLRIARDLHDGLAHAMATINVQAGAAAHVLDRRPDAAREALVAIQQASAEVLDEMGALLGLLRDAGESADRSPTPGLADVEGLFDSARRSGAPVTADVAGPVADVPPAVGMAAYRIVQESLTNAIRHAPGAPTHVRVAAGEGGALDVEIVNSASRNGNGKHPVGSGMGIVGMRERAAATGGHLDAGRAGDGGFAVRASWRATR
ncbi:MAG TPA: histidine kinase [Acidimicrobiales bacterium]|nr:histidine kinase [Acidimicrobiales bacterium]